MDFSLRRWELSDLDHLVIIANNPNIANNLTDQFPNPYTRESGEWFINFAQRHSPQQIFAIEIEGKAEGAIGIHPESDVRKKNAELGYWLAELHWGKGIISGAIKEIVKYGFETFDINRIFARPFGSNIGSQRALEKAGFHYETKFEKTVFKNGRYEDELFYAIRKE